MRQTLKLLAASLLLIGQAPAAEVGVYPNASTLTGSERFLADQNNVTVNVTPTQLEQWLFPAGYLPSSLMPVLTGDCATANGSFAITCTKTGGVSFGPFATSPAASNVVALFSGCSGSQYLGADGACHAPGGGGTVTSVGLSLPAWLQVSPSSINASGTFVVSGSTQSANQFLATPSGSAGAIAVRSIVAADLPAIALNSGTSGVLNAANGGTGVAGSLTGILKGNGSSPHTVAASSDVVSLFTGTCNGTTFLAGNGTCASPAGAGTVTSVGFAVPSGFSISSSTANPIVGSGTLTLGFAGGQTANSFLGTPNGTTGALSLRTLASGDLPPINLASTANGGTTGNLPVTKLNSGTNASSTTYWNGTGAWTAPPGNIAQLTLTAPSPLFTVSNSPLSATGTIGISFTTGLSPNLFLATPASGTGAAALRNLVAADMPPVTLTSGSNGGVTGILPVANGGTGAAGSITGLVKGNGASAFSAAVASNVIQLWSGSCGGTTYLRGDGSCQTPAGNVSSVGLSSSFPWMTVTNTPVNSSGVIGISGTSVPGNYVLASPNGSAGVVGARALVSSDIPVIPLASGVSGTLQAGQFPQLTGDVTNGVGTLATTVVRVNNGTVPTSAAVLASNSASQLVAASTTGTGSVVLSTAPTIGLVNATGLPLATGVTGTLVPANGGTGAATLTGIIKGNGTSAFTSAAFADVVTLWAGTCNSGTYLAGDGNCRAPTGVGTVTSVGASVPSWMTITGQPIVGSGVLAFGTASASANTVLAGPASGTAAPLAVRQLVAADIPAQGTSTMFVTVTANTTLSGTNTSVLVNAAGGSVQITLPTAVGDNHHYFVKKIDSSVNPVTVVTTGGQTIDTQSSTGLQFQFSSITLKSDNANWWII